MNAFYLGIFPLVEPKQNYGDTSKS